MSTPEHENPSFLSRTPPEPSSGPSHPMVPLPPGHVVLALEALQHTPHDKRLVKAARAVLGQKGCDHHDAEPRPVGALFTWSCPTCPVTASDEDVHAFAYPEGRPAEHKL